MRLGEIDRGDTLAHRALLGFISLVAGMRLPDAARVAFYHQDFMAKALGRWTQATMRGPSAWSVGERELMASMVANWNSCAYCIGAHRARGLACDHREQGVPGSPCRGVWGLTLWSLHQDLDCLEGLPIPRTRLFLF